MVASAFPLFKAAFVSAMAVALPTVQVSYGWPVGTWPAEMIVVASARGRQKWAAYPKLKDEDITLTVNFCSSTGGNVQQISTERVFALLAAAETTLRADPTLGNVITPQGAAVESWDLTETSYDDSSNGRTAMLTVVITATSRF